MVNIRELYDIWKRDLSSQHSYKKDSLLVELFICKYGFDNDEAVDAFLKDKNSISVSIYNLLNAFDTTTDFNNGINVIDDQPYSLNIPVISDSLCVIIYMLDIFKLKKKYNCILDLSKYMINKILDFCLKYNTFSKYYFNTKVVYNLFSSFILVLNDHFDDFDEAYKYRAIEMLSKNIVLINDKMSDYKDNTALISLQSLLIKLRDKLYNEVK